MFAISNQGQWLDMAGNHLPAPYYFPTEKSARFVLRQLRQDKKITGEAMVKSADEIGGSK